MIVNSGVHMFDNSNSIQKAFDSSNPHSANEHYMSKARSTLKQIVRDWSSDGQYKLINWNLYIVCIGAEERRSCYEFVLNEIDLIYTNVSERHNVNVLVTGYFKN
jgi:hypothetical protein